MFLGATFHMSKKCILITGGAGFIGSNFVHYLLDKYPDYRISIVDTLTYAASVENLPFHGLPIPDGRVEFWYGNVCNAELINARIAEANIVIHFAAETHVTRSIYDNLLFFQTDVIGTQTIANAVLKVGKQIERFVHISTSEVYGTAVGKSMDEDHPLNPMSPYASAKCGADRLVYSYVATYKIPAVIVRPFNNYGPRQHLEKVVPRFITSVLLDEDLTVHGDGTAARDFIYAEDLCRALDLVMHAPAEKVQGQVFNVASTQHRSISEIAHDIAKVMNYPRSRIVFIGDRPGQVIRHTGSAEKIKRVLGWTPAVTWIEGLERTIKWYRDNRDWWNKQLWMRQIPIRSSSGKVELH
jgi:dTDP-glucose 4,6-dehydratase